jgi:ABC-2 type transport system permease protein
MQKTLIILKNEFITTVQRPSFLFALIGLPLISAAIFLIIGMINRSQPGKVEQFFGGGTNTTQVFTGYIDQSGIIKQVPAGSNLVSYTNEEDARKGLKDGKIDGFYIVPPDYLQTGKMRYIRTDFNPLNGLSQSDGFQNVIDQNLLGNDPKLSKQYSQPLSIDIVNENPNPIQAQESAVSMVLPSIITVLFYILLVTSSSLLLSSVTKEKENRVMEILMSSAAPQQILTGKIIALGLVSLLQAAVWGGIGLVLLGSGQKMQVIPQGMSLPPSFLIWALVYFLGGYMLYASLMAGVGAMVPNLREGSQMTSLIIMPMIIPLVLMSNISQDPGGTLAVTLSLIPFTSPVTMLTRMVAGDVPLWQIILGAVLLVLGAVWVVRAVAGMFRSQVILGGQPFTRQRFFRALLGKVD